MAERQRLRPDEDEAASRRWVESLGRRSPAELDALLTHVRRTRDADQAISWIEAAGIGLPPTVYESALLVYRDTRVLTWDQCVRLARLLAWAPPRVRGFGEIDLTQYDLTTSPSYDRALVR